jgi:hypothetical protein
MITRNNPYDKALKAWSTLAVFDFSKAQPGGEISNLVEKIQKHFENEKLCNVVTIKPQ